MRFVEENFLFRFLLMEIISLTPESRQELSRAHKNNPFSVVFHVGNLSSLRGKPSMSFEGNGLSVSHHPDAWTAIAKLGGLTTYALYNPNANFYMVPREEDLKAIEWCLENGYLVRKRKYRVIQTDEEGEEFYSEFDSKREALAEDEDATPFQGYSFGQKGLQYWKSSFSEKVSHALASSFAPIFFAEANGFDGCWWDEVLDIERLSAPRGVIFQCRLDQWQVYQP